MENLKNLKEKILKIIGIIPNKNETLKYYAVKFNYGFNNEGLYTGFGYSLEEIYSQIKDLDSKYINIKITMWDIKEVNKLLLELSEIIDNGKPI